MAGIKPIVLSAVTRHGMPEALRRLRERPKALAAASLAVAAVDRLVAVAGVRPSAAVARDSSGAFSTLEIGTL